LIAQKPRRIGAKQETRLGISVIPHVHLGVLHCFDGRLEISEYTWKYVF
jgi:hypothetical protein